MALKLPINNQWTQPNTSDKFGSIHCSKNITLDEQGYVKLSPRTIAITDEATNADVGIAVGIHKFSNNSYLIPTNSDATFNLTYSVTALAATENEGTNNPTHTNDSHSVFWQNLLFASTDTTVVSRAISTSDSVTWTDRITGLTSGVRHYLKVFESKIGLTVSDGNFVRLYNTSYSNTVSLELPTDYEVIGMAYNNARMGVITRLGTASVGQSQDTKFFIWDGSSTRGDKDASIGAPSAIGIVAYKSSFAILTQTGQLLYWNGGGFTELASLPFYFTDKVWGDIINQLGTGEIMSVEGDKIFINIGAELEVFGRKGESYYDCAPSGVWCYDQRVGLYHRYSASASNVYLLTESSVNTGTDVITLSSGTIPATGNPIRYTSASTAIGGLTVNQDYWVIKVTSSTLKLATTKANALAGTAIDLTGAGSNSFFWAYDLVDFGCSTTDGFGATVPTGESNILTRDVIFGSKVNTTALTGNDAICIGVPFLENRGYIVTPKVYSSQAEDTAQKLLIKYRPLDTEDKIVVKVKTEDVIGLPVSEVGTGATWSSTTELSVAQDLSEAKTYIDAGNALEIEILSGAGGGSMVNVTSIDTSDNITYSLVLDEEVLGAASTLKCEFVLNNWEEIETIDSTTDSKNYTEVLIGKSSKWYQFKIELRGYETTIEEMQIINALHKASK